MRKFCLVKLNIFLRPSNNQNACKGFVWESRIPHSVLVRNLCDIKVYSASLITEFEFQKKVNHGPEWNVEFLFPNKPFHSITLISGSVR